MCTLSMLQAGNAKYRSHVNLNISLRTYLNFICNLFLKKINRTDILPVYLK